MGHRVARLESQIKDELSMIMLLRYHDREFGLITITAVKLSPDLKVAKVYFSVFDKEQRKNALEKITAEIPSIRHELASKIRVRFMPELRFFVDDTSDYVEKIEGLLKQIHKNDNQTGNELQGN
ncbi:MAG: 30S ribosome-binding factor RbfA [Bacteroidetes bacterium]|nr:30S ribosome-binding factor RbfA [Bacteroidota bacterium]